MKIGRGCMNAVGRLRLTYRKARKGGMPSVLVRCGDCANRFVISYEPENPDPITDQFVEIAGVVATISEWRKLFRWVFAGGEHP